MNAVVPARRFRVVVFAAFLSGAAVADETPPPTGIAAAKRDYAEVKAATADGAEMQKLAAPKDAPPALNLSVAAFPVLGPRPSVPLRKDADTTGPTIQKSKNWLVDAMEKPSGKADVSLTVARDGSGKSDAIENDSGSRAKRSPENQMRSASDRGGDEAPVQSAKASNPLDRFMAAWMTASDFKLLQAAKDREVSNDGLGNASFSGDFGTPVLSDFNAPPVSTDHRAQQANPLEEPAANPYLVVADAVVATPPVQRDSITPAGMPIVSSQNASTASPLLPEPGTPERNLNSAASEFQRAQDDARYFKQLKRF